MSHFDPRALLVFVCTAKKQRPKTLESRMVEVSDWELTGERIQEKPNERFQLDPLG